MKKITYFIIFDILEILGYVLLGFLTNRKKALLLYILSRIVVFRTYPEFQAMEKQAINEWWDKK